MKGVDGWMGGAGGGRWWVGRGWQRGGYEAEGGLQLLLGHNGDAVCSVRDRNRHDAEDRQRWSLAVVWHHSHPY